MMRAWSQSQSEPLPGSGRVRKEPPSIAKYNDSPPPNGVRSTVLLDLSPLRKHRDFRCVFVGQLISAFGSFLTYVALPVQIYDLTKSSAIVGLLGTVQL